MNKKLLIAAIGAALVAGPVSAATTIFGQVNVGIARIDNGNATNADTIGVTDDTTRLGFKGDEDIGGGLKAIYQMDFAVDGDAGNFTAGRDTFAGLQGGWGTLRVGFFNSAHKAVEFPVEFFADTIADFTADGWAGEGRIANAISYTSPNFAGFSFGVESARGETGTTTEANQMILAGTYKAGPLYVGLGIHDFDLTGGLEKSTNAAASFAFGPFTVGLAMQMQDHTTAASEVDSQVLLGSYKFGNNTIAASLKTVDSATANADCEVMSLGWFHALSKMTTVRFVYSDIDNESGAACMGRMSSTTGSIGLPATTAGNDPNGFQVNLNLKF
jgi:predicted porin